MRTIPSFTIAAITLGLVVGCASVPRRAGFADVERVAADRLDRSVYWYQGGPEDQEVAEEVGRLLTTDLTLDSAIQIALLNNRMLQAEYEQPGVAQADLVQAGLLCNPVFFAVLLNNV